MPPEGDESSAVKSEKRKQLLTFFALYAQLTNLATQMRSCRSLYRHHNKKCRRLRLELQKNAAELSNLFLMPPNKLRKRLWIQPRTSEWWDSVVPEMPDSVWKEHFRITKQTFTALCGRLKQRFERKDTNYRKCIPLEKRVAMCVYVLSSKADLSTVARLFGVGKSTLNGALREFCTQISNHIMPELIVFPASTDSLQGLIDGFFHDWQFPQAFGALDGCHIHVSPPKDFGEDYYCRKKFYSIVLLAICDYAHRFLYINADTPGCNNDASVFYKSGLPRIISDNPNFINSAKHVQGLKVEPVILTDSAFPLKPNLIKPYQNGPHLTLRQRLFNDQLLIARNVIDIAFARLKARFPILAKLSDYNINNVTTIIQTCCTLHNLCEIMGDQCDADWTGADIVTDDSICTLGETDTLAQNVRNTFSLYFQHNL